MFGQLTATTTLTVKPKGFITHRNSCRGRTFEEKFLHNFNFRNTFNKTSIPK